MRVLVMLFVLLLVSLAHADEEKLTHEETLEGENVSLEQKLYSSEFDRLQAEISSRGTKITIHAKTFDDALRKKYHLSADDKFDFTKGIIVRAPKPETKPKPPEKKPKK